MAGFSLFARIDKLKFCVIYLHSVIQAHMISKLKVEVTRLHGLDLVTFKSY